MSKDKSLKIYPLSYIVLDIETTGLSPQKNEIIELSAIKVLNGEVKKEFSKLVKPNGYISPFISNLTGITKDMLKEAPQIDEAIWDFKEFCSDSIVLGHNINFDLNFINTKLMQCHNITFNNDYIDTLKIARKLLPELPSKKLGLVASHFNLNTDGMHRGLKDCTVTNLCYLRFLEMMNINNNLNLF